ncbi:MAG: helix-turn-helix domain-containing protein [Bacteroidia bacterium]|nr:helix-turn-helix domain-containing protein [Bacteroidia bacterium]
MENYFASNLKYLRHKHDKSQDALALVIGKTRSMIGYYENGLSIPDLKILTELANYFHVGLDELVNTDLRNPNKTFVTENIVREPQAEYGAPKDKDPYIKQILQAKDDVIKAKEAEIQALKDLITELREKVRRLDEELKKKR